jgi:hypothetical protein
MDPGDLDIGRKKFSRKAAKAQRKDESPSGNIAASDSFCLVGRFTALW